MSKVEPDARLDALESEIAFLEDTVRKLNDALVGQQARIDGLEVGIRALAERIREQSDDSERTAPEDPPPHY